MLWCASPASGGSATINVSSRPPTTSAVVGDASRKRRPAPPGVTAVRPATGPASLTGERYPGSVPGTLPPPRPVRCRQRRAGADPAAGSSPMNDSFTNELWRGAAGIYAAILAHPFLTGLTDGKLPEDAFTYFVVQDVHYLRGYARALAGVATRAPEPREPDVRPARRRRDRGRAGTARLAPRPAWASIPRRPRRPSRSPTTTGLRQLPARYRPRRILRRRGWRRAAVLLDLLGSRQGAAAAGLARTRATSNGSTPTVTRNTARS